MVRIISQNFSPPRSRHSSGETDRDLAERTRLALSTLGRKRIDVPEYESSSDSFWDSELDWDQAEALVSEAESEKADINGNDPREKSEDPQTKRKQRRRERNKLSAQAYRQRRRTQNVKEKEQLFSLESENKRLHKLVETLEKETEQAKQYLRGMLVPMPDILSPVGEEGSAEVAESSQGCVAGATASSLSLPVPAKHRSKEYVIPEILEAPEACPQAHSQHSLKAPDTQAAYQNNNMLPEKPLHPCPPAESTSQQRPSVHPPEVPIQSHILINAPTLITSPVSTPENLNGATAAVPTYLAVPVEPTTQCFPPANLNSLSNLNQGFAANSTPVTNGVETPTSNWLGQTAVIGATAAPVLGTAWNGQNGTVASLNGNVFSIIKMEMCNNGNVNLSSNMNENFAGNANLMNDSNGNQNNSNTMTMKSVNPQILSFKINLNQTTGLHNQVNVGDLRSQESGRASLSQAAVGFQ